MTVFRIKSTVRRMPIELFFKRQPTETDRDLAVDRFFAESGIEEKAKLYDQVRAAIQEASVEEIDVLHN